MFILKHSNKDSSAFVFGGGVQTIKSPLAKRSESEVYSLPQAGPITESNIWVLPAKQKMSPFVESRKILLLGWRGGADDNVL